MNVFSQKMNFELQTPHKLALLAGLYFSQGLPFGFFTQALPVILREQNVSLEKIGLSSILALPWLTKILFAPFIDEKPFRKLSFLGHHRSYILPLQLGSILLLFAMSWLDAQENLVLLLAAVGFSNFFAATQDVATDSLAVHILNDDDRSYGNGIQVGAYRAGMILSGGTLLMLMSALGWSLTFGIMALLLFLATIPTILFNEPAFYRREKAKAEAKPHSSLFKKELIKSTYWTTLLSAFKKKHIAPWIFTLFIVKLGDNFATGMLRPFLVDQGYSKADIGWWVGVLGFSASLLGAGFGSVFFARISRRKGLLLFIFLQALAVSLYALAPLFAASGEVIQLAILADHFFGGMATVALFTCMMDTCEAHEAATQFTLQASVVVLGTGLGSALSGISAGQIGHQMHFTLGALFSLACTAAAVLSSQSYKALAKTASSAFLQKEKT